MLMEKRGSLTPQVIVVGGIFLDYKRYCSTDNGNLANERVLLSHGGIGRNVAENLAWLGSDVGLITLSSPVEVAQEITDRLCRAGVQLAARSVDGGIGSFTVTLDYDGNLLHETAIQPDLAMLNWDFVSQYRHWLVNARYIVVEMGLGAELLDLIMQEARQNSVPVCGLPTRIATVGPRWDLLRHLDCLVLNMQEASLILDRPVDTVPHALRAIHQFGQEGIAKVAITMGAAGVVAGCSGAMPVVLPALEANVLDTTGAGDAFTAGLLRTLVTSNNFEKGLSLGLMMAQRTVETHDTVKSESVDLLLENSDIL